MLNRPLRTCDTLVVRLCCVYAVATLPLMAAALISVPAPFSLFAWLLGLTIMAIGAVAFASRPLARLNQRVARWRSGNGFDDTGTGGPVSASRDLRRLIIAFRRATMMLHRQQIRLATAVDQQELLMQEIHHRVKNNLQIVASLLRPAGFVNPRRGPSSNPLVTASARWRLCTVTFMPTARCIRSTCGSS